MLVPAIRCAWITPNDAALRSNDKRCLIAPRYRIPFLRLDSCTSQLINRADDIRQFNIVIAYCIIYTTTKYVYVLANIL